MTISLPFCVIPTPLGTITTGNEIAAKPAAHLNEFKYIGMTWRSSGNTNLWVRGNFGSAKPMDFLSVVSANALAGTTIRLRLGDSQAEVDGTADYDSTALAFISPSITREDGLYHSHLEFPSITKQWWRIDIGGHTGDFEAAAIVLGKKVQAANFYSAGFEFGVEDQSEFEMTRFGIPDEADGLIFRQLGFVFEWMSETEFETMFRPLTEKLGKRGVGFWCFDPTANTYRQARTYMGWLTKPPYAKGGTIKYDRYTKEFQILSMI